MAHEHNLTQFYWSDEPNNNNNNNNGRFVFNNLEFFRRNAFGRTNH